jgi:hypothetical protein
MRMGSRRFTILVLLGALASGVAGRWPWQKGSGDSALDAADPAQRKEKRWPWTRGKGGRQDSTAFALQESSCRDGSCDEVASWSATCTDSSAACALGSLQGPAGEGQWVIDPDAILSTKLRVELSANLSRFNSTSGGLKIYLVVTNEVPQELEGKLVTPRDFSKKLLREWFPRSERIALILLVPSTKRMEVALGSRARRQMKDSVARRIARKVQTKLGNAQFDEAARQAVREMVQGLAKKQGFAGSLRAILMPVMVVCVLLFMCKRAARDAPPCLSCAQGSMADLRPCRVPVCRYEERDQAAGFR